MLSEKTANEKLNIVQLYGSRENRITIEDFHGYYFSEFEYDYLGQQFNLQMMNGQLVRMFIDGKKAFVKRGFAKYFK